MALKIIKASEIKKKGTLNALFYGSPGMGKTTLAASAPKPILFIDIEDGTISISGEDDIDVAKCDTVPDVQAAVKHALDGDYKTIVIDSLTIYSDMVMDDVLSKNRRVKPIQADWGEVGVRVKNICQFLKKQSVNVIYICQEKEIDSESGGRVVRPFLMTSLVTKINSIVDLVGYIHIDEKKNRKVSVNTTARWYAKSRTPRDQSITEDLEPDFGVILDRVYKGNKTDSSQNELNKGVIK